MSSSAHYSLAHQPQELWDWAKKAVFQLHNICKDRHPILIYRGMSGIATATALSIAYCEKYGESSISMIYVRKPNEDSHGKQVEYKIHTELDKLRCDSVEIEESERKYVLVFVDDFVSSGDTRLQSFAAVIKAKQVYSKIPILPPKTDRKEFIQVCSGDHSGGSRKIETIAYSLSTTLEHLWKSDEKKSTDRKEIGGLPTWFMPLQKELEPMITITTGWTKPSASQQMGKYLQTEYIQGEVGDLV